MMLWLIMRAAKQVLQDETLKRLAHELVEKIRANVSIDWTQREAVRASLRRMVKRLLRKYGYPPDLQVQATELILRQSEKFTEWNLRKEG
jgi:type I restriction enzyme R subunit